MEYLHKQPDKSQTPSDVPWQLKLFKHKLKKQQKLEALLDMMGNVKGQKCILITCGDNNGALNWHLKERGGKWTWADAERESRAQISELTGDPVLKVDKDEPTLSLPDNRFDVVMTIDVHEHLQDTARLNAELARIVMPGGRVIVTTPGGDPRRIANRIKHRVGMSAIDYGHVVDGYDVPALQAQMSAAGLKPTASSSYSRFFIEMIELAMNFVFVKVLSKRSEAKVEQGQIAPQNPDQLKSVEKSYKMYSLVYPIVWLLSRLDYLIPFTEGHAVIVVGQKD